MGPGRNAEAYKLTGDSTNRMIEERSAQEKAANVLMELSRTMSEYPIRAAVVEPTLTPKIYALGKINIDPLGVAGPNPMSFYDVGYDGGVSISAFAAPPHDSFTDKNSGYEIGTRVVLLLSFSGHNGQADQEKQDLEFFGLNMFVIEPDNVDKVVKEEETLTEEEAQKRLLTAMEQAEKPELMVVQSKPITGETSIFAIRHKKHGIVKLYSTSVKQREEVIVPVIGDEVLRSGDQTVIVPVANGLVVEITQISTRNSSYDDILNEFRSAISNLAAQKALDSTRSLSPDEITAIRSSLNSGVSPVELFRQFIH